MAPDFVFPFHDDLTKDMGMAAQERAEVKKAMNMARRITIGPTILPHDFPTKKPFYYWNVDRTRRKVVGKKPERPRHILNHVINRKRFHKKRLAVDRDLPPESSPTRRSSRVEAQKQAKQAAQASSQAPTASSATAPSLAPASSTATPASSTPGSQRQWDQNTLDVAAVLGLAVDNDFCEMCGGYCEGNECYSKFLREKARVFAHSVEVKETGGVMGLGLYVKQTVQGPIKKGQVLDEYLGDLYPPNSIRIKDTSYVFEIKDVVRIDARLQGNYTRFVNHHCEPNIIADRVRIGRRRTLVFRAKRDLIPGEQIFVNYSSDYFKEGKRYCQCDAKEGPHIPSLKKS